MSKVPLQARGRRNRFFEAEGVDELVSAVLELTAEVSVLRERLYAAERVLESHGIAVGDGIEAWQPSAREAGELAAERQRLVATVLRTMSAASSNAAEAPSASVDPASMSRAA